MPSKECSWCLPANFGSSTTDPHAPRRRGRKPASLTVHRCFFCKCTRCGEEHRPPMQSQTKESIPPSTLDISHASPLLCVACGSRTHSECVDSRAVMKSGKGKPRFFCSTECLLDVKVLRNPYFQADVCERVEQWCEIEWAKSMEKDGTNCSESNDESIDNRYRRLRLCAWRQYFELEAAEGIPLLLLPRHVFENLPARESEALCRLLTPAGQAHALHTLHPSSHPVGSAIATPSEKWWNAASIPPLPPPPPPVPRAHRKECRKDDEEQPLTRKRGRTSSRFSTEDNPAGDDEDSQRMIAALQPMNATALGATMMNPW